MGKIVTYRICVLCGKEKATSAFQGQTDQCRKCLYPKDRKAYIRNWTKLNKEKTSAYTRKWRKNNAKRVKETKRLWIKNNPDKVAEEKRRSYQKHKEKIKKARREAYHRNPEKDKASQAKWRAKNRERASEATKTWRKENPDANRAFENKRRAIKASVDGFYTANEWMSLCDKYENKCLRCKEVKPLTVDHVIPLSKGGSNWIENIQPLCRSCNSAKGTKIEDYRY